ncbi:hypothetical protein FPY71_00865 [Aureimonas fodinaquatilis]|uniref:Uncharacterized protein n=1 Tax=Aureimonas fodinaquatilis TaxID=2565783 RepID=A0A5B0DY17_9HYPH|nr:hypothetical protein [Aureimonas fodinaquatilis]KAA0971717.1 hypothetical protein FPY71_00865 [Aureimonas fodinaquatilis]
MAGERNDSEIDSEMTSLAGQASRHCEMVKRTLGEWNGSMAELGEFFDTAGSFYLKLAEEASRITLARRKIN